MELNATGYRVGAAVFIPKGHGRCNSQTLGVNAAGSVYLPLCNGSLAVYGPLHRQQLSFDVGYGLVPIAAQPSTTGTVYLADAKQTSVLFEYDVNKRQVVRQLAAYDGVQLIQVAVNTTDQTVWAIDSNNSTIWHWTATGRLLSGWSVLEGLVPSRLALDNVHGWVMVSGTKGLSGALVWLDAQTGVTVGSWQWPIGYDAPFGFAVTSDGSRVYALSYITQSVYVLQQTREEGRAEVKQLQLTPLHVETA